MKLEAAEIELIRTDPAAWIRSMTIPDRTVVISDRKTASTLRVGHDTLADAFGDKIYLAKKDGLVECPGCGRWKGKVHTVVPGCISEYCSDCDLKLPGDDHDKWMSVDTGILLTWSGGVGCVRIDRFFIPRKWNETGPWISRADLSEKYHEFIEEKDNV